MSLPLTSSDFPLYSVGSLVYAKMQSSPILTAMDDQMAANIVTRLNHHEMPLVNTDFADIERRILSYLLDQGIDGTG
jgi:hypothetical protein